jgi:hypothetical protein
MPKPKVIIKKVYSKESHTKKPEHYFAPVYSVGTYGKDSFKVVVHMTPELKRHPTERKVLLKHEEREAKLLAEGKSKHYAHSQAAKKEPVWLKGQKGYAETWKRLGKKPP